MAFDEIRFPIEISYGSRGGPGFNTAVLENDSRQDERIARGSLGRHGYDVAFGIRDLDDIGSVITFFLARKGAVNGFRYKDWQDFSTASNGRNAPDYMDVLIGTGDGATTTFQLIKRYEDAAGSYVRTVSKPVSGSVVIGVNSILTGSGWTVNTTTGVVTFSVAPTTGYPITAGFYFDVPVRFAKEIDIGLLGSIDTIDTGSVGSIPLIELLDETTVSDDIHYGGGTDLGTLTADTSITPINGRAITFAANTAGLVLRLPDPANYTPGGPYFFLSNEGTQNISVQDTLGNVIGTLNAASVVEVILIYNAASNKRWLFA